MTFWQQSIDIYCERSAPGLWNEPFNAVSNIGFFAAGAWGLVVSRKQRSAWLPVASGTVLLTGTGSVLFHTFANQWSHLADLVPILLFMAVSVSFTFREVLGFSIAATCAVVIVFMAITLGVEFGPLHPLLNGSAVYVPTVALLATLGGVLTRQRSPVARHFLAAAIVFTVSIIARTLDSASCAAFPHGTHFIWHLLNAILLAILLNAMFVQGVRR